MRRTSRASLLLAVLAAPGLAGVGVGPVRADAPARPRIAVLDVVIEGDAPPELREGLDRSLAGGLYAAGYEVVSREDVAGKLRAARELVGCVTTTCLARTGELVGARRFVRARVDAAGASYTIELSLLGADAPGGAIARVERSCAVCTIAEANDAMSAAAAELREGAPAPAPVTARLIVRSRPEGAEVTVDGVEAGRAPVEVELAPGEHRVRAVLPGHAAAERLVTVEAPAAAAAAPPTVELVLLREAAAAGPAPAAAGERFRVWKWAGAGGAAAALVAGIVLVAIDDDGADCPYPGAPCRTLYDTMTGGLLLTGAGLALGGTSTWMFWSDRSSARGTGSRISTPQNR